MVVYWGGTAPCVMLAAEIARASWLSGFLNPFPTSHNCLRRYRFFGTHNNTCAARSSLTTVVLSTARTKRPASSLRILRRSLPCSVKLRSLRSPPRSTRCASPVPQRCLFLARPSLHRHVCSSLFYTQTRSASAPLLFASLACFSCGFQYSFLVLPPPVKSKLAPIPEGWAQKDDVVRQVVLS